MTTIERLHQNGILRTGSPARGFKYKHADGKKISAEDRARIDDLKIPPAWTDVAISAAPTGRVQVVGQDAAGRWQYLYHDSHVRNQQRKKFKRLISFGESLPAMRKSVRQDLKQSELSRQRVMASILRILSMSFIRPGSEIYASENGSYGIATLRPRHVSVRGDEIIFEFTGKAGKDHRREIRDRQVRYIKEVMGHRFTAKDFRTWAGTLICACALARSANSNNGKLPQAQRIMGAIKETAEALGNTPAISRDAYICPEVIKSFEMGEILKYHFEDIEELIAYRGIRLHPAERALLRLLRESNS